MLDNLMQDLRHAVRGLRHSPGFATVAILTLGLGIGANAAIFSVINATLLRPLPYEAPGRLVTVQHHYPSFDLKAPVSIPGFRDYQGQAAVFERAAVQTGWQPNLTGDGEPERLVAARATGDFFRVFGVAPALGRTFRPEEAQAGADHVVVLSDTFWRRKMAGDSAVIGRRLQLDGESYEIIGVMPATFRDFWNRRVELWAPLAFRPDQFADGNRTNEFLNFTGRLQPGVTAQRAGGDLHQLAVRLKQQFPDSYAPEWDLLVTPLYDIATQNVRRGLYVLLGAVGLVLLIACANVANLQLARASSRARELAVRVALGAAPGRLMRYMLTESMVLALSGGALGLLLAIWGVPALLALNNQNLPPTEEIRVDAAVLGFTLLVSALTGLLFGILPAARMVKTDLHGTLKEGGRGHTADRGGLALRRALVVTTVAVALTLLTGAGLLIRSFGRLLAVDPGFNPANVLTFQVALPASRYTNDTVRVAMLERLVQAVRATPGVVAAGGTHLLPFSGGWSTGSFNIEGFQPPPDQNGPWGDQRIVTPEYLPALGVELVSGRYFTAQDRDGAPLAVIVDDEMVRRYWPGQDAVGKRVTFNNLTDSNITWMTVVGVVRHTMHEGLDGQTRIQMYRPLAQVPISFMSFAVRTAGEPLAVLPSVRASIRAVDDQLPLAAVNTMEEMIDASAGPRRFAMILLGSFAALAMVLASIGLYGVMSYTVTQRTQELGVRIALGAGTRNVLGLVLGDGMKLVGLGVVIGLAAAFGVTRLMTSMLFETPPTDLLTFATIPLLLIGVALLASWLPARRAARVDPLAALRAE
jgi:putative ABC transport system permease protein